MLTISDLRQFRIGPFTIFDTVTAYLGVLIVSPILRWLFSKLHLKVPVSSWLWLTMPLSVIFHVVFHQTTPLMKILADPGQIQFYIAVLILLAMTFLGLRKISRIK